MLRHDRDRLRRALSALGHAKGEARASPPATPAPPDVEDALLRILGGRWESTAAGQVFVRECRYPLEHRHGKVSLKALLQVPGEALSWLARREAAPPPESLAFVDMETTGLSGGTGTYAVLVCVGSFEPAHFVMRQYFLVSPQTEPAMLHAVARDLERFEGVVSFNGRTFDLPLLQTRMTLAKLPDPSRGRAHIDLLFPVRRLYRQRLESCRLSEAESRLLGFHRDADLPGHLVPSVYFDYLRAQRIAPLRGVFRHNEEDVLSLVALLAHVAALLTCPDPDPLDALALGRWWEIEGAMERAEAYYRRAFHGLTPGREWQVAAGRYARIRKRAGARAEVLDLWQTLWDRGDEAAGVEIAKYLEHEARNLAAAEEVTLRLLSRATGAGRAALEHRLARLRRRRGRARP